MRACIVVIIAIAGALSACDIYFNGGDDDDDDTPNACDGLTADQCSATPGCVADTCFACSCTPRFAACRASNEPAYECPVLGCPQPLCCHDNADCGPSQFYCLGPRDSRGCGVCNPMSGTCVSDADCGTDICEPIACSCAGASACVPGCRDAGCEPGTTCDVTSNRCVPETCNAQQPCPVNFDCTADGCLRRTCSDDRACDGVCVLGVCESSLGECSLPVP